jgi:hypothetical protein
VQYTSTFILNSVITKYHVSLTNNTSPLPYDILVTGLLKTVFKRP